MTSFTTFNQFDARFAVFEKFGKDRTACPLFGLITCHNFMLNGDISQNQHERNIQSAISNYVINEVPKYMLFDELLVLTNGSLNPADINATSPELLTTGVVGYEHMFKFGYNQNYCLLILKGRNYITVLYKWDPAGETYAVRNCHEQTQRNFTDFESLRVFLNNTYQFEQPTMAGGLPIPEFDNVEFLTIDVPFELVNVDVDLVDDTLDVKTEYKEEEVVETINVYDGKKVSDDMDQYIALSFAAEEGEFNGDDYVDFV